MREQVEVIHTDPDTGGQKGEKPCRMDLIPAPFVWEVGEVYGMGARKYNDHNWAKGYKWSCSVAALFRHLYLWLRGEAKDKESGFHHLAHVVWHCAALFMFEKNKLGKDDRLPAGLDLSDTLSVGELRQVVTLLENKGDGVLTFPTPISKPEDQEL